jgi:CRISPR system Cascade subunit CasC
MSDFVQLHILTGYPPANLNRDDLGSPKTVIVGGANRLRISSQSLKRAWRTSDVFKQALDGGVGVRTREMGVRIYDALTTGTTLEEAMTGKTSGDLDTLPETKAYKIAESMAKAFASTAKPSREEQEAEGKKRASLKTGQLVHYGPAEIQAMAQLVERARRGEEIGDSDFTLLRKDHAAADIAMFGRMLADNPGWSVEAAVQVSHAFTVQKVAVEDDFFSAVDDLNKAAEETGAGHLGVNMFGAGLFYLYVCMDRGLLEENLAGDKALATRALKALTEAALTVAPTGKQASYASRAYAAYVLAEKGTQQPRSLAVSFLQPAPPGDMFSWSIKTLETVKKNMDKVYGLNPDEYRMDAINGEGSLDELLGFVAE